VLICVDGMFICLSFHFCISIIFINLRNKLVIINLRYKEIELHNKIFQHNKRSIVTNCSSGISMTIYRSIIFGVGFPNEAFSHYDLVFIYVAHATCVGFVSSNAKF
jgi:hypothetical protein